ncbi:MULTISPECIES: HAD family hydrolase [Vibrio]|uniref:HAD family hydrolase n=1 Tax=Vibrio TaxID=662 RepID=UPI000C163DBC|nr:MULTISPECIES: HAD family hydrolase [Vibrio]NAW68371.1 HAD-IA family hydrolase [Vibrio sp. V28_P6S34P95]NAX04779.1 HAD-IA family hydrolase [Vibrio sp. V30_P3S12P165]NAX34596.1 HAD-IA family hydrolase [Vibrio sp. V29_P1S30P107]NAX37635.1 HAD-IA family hydrolase [Vibrio sp. V27_P1S3P104]NAX39900.1 HAD-IA family hydrolase [Vibrio sp. V26_P1S5P106]
MEKAKFRCVIFDCEGTLVDSERLCCMALVKVFNALGAQLTFQDVAQHFSGGKIADILSDTLELAGMSADLDLLESRYRQELESIFMTQLKAMPGSEFLLQQLDKYQIEYCVASNAPYEKMVSCLSRAGLAERFDGKIFSAFEANSWKPEPDLIRYCAMNMGFSLDECVYVDDTAKGVKAGVSAGVATFQLQPLSSLNHFHHPNVQLISQLDELIEYLF